MMIEPRHSLVDYSRDKLCQTEIVKGICLDVPIASRKLAEKSSSVSFSHYERYVRVCHVMWARYP